MSRSCAVELARSRAAAEVLAEDGRRVGHPLDQDVGSIPADAPSGGQKDIYQEPRRADSCVIGLEGRTFCVFRRPLMRRAHPQEAGSTRRFSDEPGRKQAWRLRLSGRITHRRNCPEVFVLGKIWDAT